MCFHLKGITPNPLQFSAARGSKLKVAKFLQKVAKKASLKNWYQFGSPLDSIMTIVCKSVLKWLQTSLEQRILHSFQI